MKKCLINYVTICILGLTCLPAFAATVPYSTDFSTDPGWVTDQPSNYYWDAGSQSYHVRAENHATGYQPSRYAYKLLPESVGSFELRWDVKPTSIGWSAGIMFGVYDEHLITGGINGGQSIQALCANVDGGYLWGLYVDGPGDMTSFGSDYGTVAMEQWYTSILTYDAVTNAVSYEVKNRDTGASIWTINTSVQGGNFTNDLKYLGSCRGGIGDGYHAGYPGMDPFGVAEGYIDNVNLTPEPATLLLLGLGGLALRKRRAG